MFPGCEPLLVGRLSSAFGAHDGWWGMVEARAEVEGSRCGYIVRGALV